MSRQSVTSPSAGPSIASSVPACLATCAAIAGTSSFGLDTPGKRIARLFFQPVLVALALWVTGGPRYDAPAEAGEAGR